MTTKAKVCAFANQHTEGPADYLAWHAWAEAMEKDHRQIRCPGCDLYKVWVPKANASTRKDRDA